MNPQAAFREVNDSIRQLPPQGTAGDTYDFFCECPNLECHAMVRLTLREFDARRAASAPLPILATHVDGQPNRLRRTTV